MGLLSKGKAAIARHYIKDLPDSKEIQTMADEAKKSGVPPWAANVAALVGGFLVAAVQDVASGGNFGELLSNPKALAAAVVSAILIRVAHSLNPPKK